MYIRDIAQLLEADIKSGETLLDSEVLMACGSDMMSEVLAYVHDQGVLLTGLVNEQIIRTAAMMNMSCVVMVRGKQPTESMIEMAEENDIALLTTEKTMYDACGRLYIHGLNREGKSYV